MIYLCTLFLLLYHTVALSSRRCFGISPQILILVIAGICTPQRLKLARTYPLHFFTAKNFSLSPVMAILLLVLDRIREGALSVLI